MIRPTACIVAMLTLTLGVAGGALASDAVQGTTTTFQSPNGVVERCVRIAPMPGATYTPEDLAAETAFCAINFYAPAVAVCPKVWSTSPGMIVFDIAAGPYARDRAAFERNACREGKGAYALARADLAKFKPTMNQPGTSGTFSASPLLYYHFSRYFRMEVHVPVAVWRSMDRAAHLSEVARPGLALSGHAQSSRMNHAGWAVLVAADQNPASYQPIDDLFTADRRAIYGVMLRSSGSRYGAEVNGTRRSGWGAGQNRDFQETPPFLALRSPKPLAEAIADGLAQGRRDPQIARDLGAGTSPHQMAFWMREISEIVLLDFLFSQQDRVGNIDYAPFRVRVENGRMLSERVDPHHTADAPAGSMLIRRTQLNDNDAGARVEYANFARTTGMLERLRHFDAGVYRRLMALDADFRGRGPLHAHLMASFGLDQAQARQVVVNTGLAAAILRETCRRGEMRFDLDPVRFLVEGAVTAESVACTGG